ncbi:MAG: hypothetical protein R2838_02015 [Caldilineaceae bacterium]
MRAGSRVSYTTLLKVADAGQLGAIAEPERRAQAMGQGVETYLTAPSGVQRFFENLLFFLSLVAIFTLLLARHRHPERADRVPAQRYTTIAIVKTLKRTRRFVTSTSTPSSAFGAAGHDVGRGAGAAPATGRPCSGRPDPAGRDTGALPARGVGGAAAGRVCGGRVHLHPAGAAGRTQAPLYLPQEEIGLHRRWPYLVALLLILAAFAAMVLWLLDDWRTSLYFTGAVLGLLAIAAALAEVTLRLLRGRRPRSLPLRQALRGLFRPRNPTRAIIITLSASLAVLFCIYLVERTLDASFVAAYPEDAPNVFFWTSSRIRWTISPRERWAEDRVLPSGARDRCRSQREPPRRVDEDEQTRGGPDGPDGGRDFSST